jgi:hypothetical protein
MTTQPTETAEPEGQTFNFSQPGETTPEPVEAPTTPVAPSTPNDEITPSTTDGAPSPLPAGIGGTPAAVPAPAPTGPPPPRYTPEQINQLQMQNEYLKRQHQANQQAEAQQQFNDAMSQQEQSLLEQGYSQEQASAFVQAYSKPYEQMQQQSEQLAHARTQAQQIEQGATNKMNLIFRLSKQYGVEPTELQNYNDPASMTAAAKQAAYIRGLNDKIVALQQGRVPPGQAFDSGRGAGVSSSAAERATLREQDAPWSDAQFAKMKAHLGM